MCHDFEKLYIRQVIVNMMSYTDLAHLCTKGSKDFKICRAWVPEFEAAPTWSGEALVHYHSEHIAKRERRARKEWWDNQANVDVSSYVSPKPDWWYVKCYYGVCEDFENPILMSGMPRVSR